MTVYATRLVNGTDTRERMRRADALGMFPSGAGMARGGFRNDGGGVVSVNAGTMTVNVTAFTAWVDGGVSDAQGGYAFVSDAAETLTVSAGHASLSRTDVVIAEVRDTTHDGSGSTDARVRILEGTAGAGTPALPTNALALRNITVPAGTSAGTGGLSSGNLSTDRRTYTTGLGGVLTVASSTERDALPTIAGTLVYRTDTDTLERRKSASWVSLDKAVATAAAATHSVADSTFDTLELAETADPDGIYTAATGQYVIPRAGIYALSGVMQIPSAAGAGAHRLMTAFLNGTEDARAAGVVTASGSMGVSLSYTRLLAAGDVITFRAYQDSGAAMNMTNLRTAVTLIRET